MESLQTSVFSKMSGSYNETFHMDFILVWCIHTNSSARKCLTKLCAFLHSNGYQI